MQKTGVISIRIDNPYITVQENALTDFATILSNHGCKALIAENLEANIIRTGNTYLIDEYKSIENYHEIADTTPSDSCDWFKIPTGYESFYEQYIGNGIAEIIDDTPYKKAILERIHVGGKDGNAFGELNSFTLNEGTNRIDGDFSARPKDRVYLYIDNQIGEKIGWQPAYSINDSSAYIRTVDLRTITFEATETVNMYLTPTGALYVTLSNISTYLLFKAGKDWFEFLGFKTNNCWIHPGGLWANVKDDATMLALKSLGMKFADTYDATYRNLTYNFIRINKYAGHTWGDVNGYITIDDAIYYGDTTNAKKYISDSIAKNHHITLKSHTYYAHLPGETTAEKIQYHLNAWDVFLQWIEDNNIPVITYTEMRQQFIDSETDPYFNIMPKLNIDLAGQGKPDGYTLGSGSVYVTNDGAGADGTYSIKLNGNGELFTISDLGGMEKGLNGFKIYLKGEIGAVLTIQMGNLGNLIFTINDSGWNEFNLSDSTGITEINITDEINFIDIIATSSNNDGNDLFIGSMKMHKLF